MHGHLHTELRIADPDAFYEKLLDAHAGLGEQERALLDARLILLLANQVGDDAVLSACIEVAKGGAVVPAQASHS